MFITIITAINAQWIVKNILSWTLVSPVLCVCVPTSAPKTQPWQDGITKKITRIIIQSTFYMGIHRQRMNSGSKQTFPEWEWSSSSCKLHQLSFKLGDWWGRVYPRHQWAGLGWQHQPSLMFLLSWYILFPYTDSLRDGLISGLFPGVITICVPWHPHSLKLKHYKRGSWWNCDPRIRQGKESLNVFT